MNEWLGPLLTGLRNARLDVSAEDVADALWLASHRRPEEWGTGEVDEGDAEEEEQEAPEEIGTSEDASDPAAPTLQESRPEVPRYAAGGRPGLYLPGSK